mgnify:FL=1|jgi:hypothetical protein
MGCLSLLIADDLQGYEHGSTEPTEPLGEVERFELINGRALEPTGEVERFELINGRALRADRRGGALRVDFIRRQKWQLHR